MTQCIKCGKKCSGFYQNKEGPICYGCTKTAKKFGKKLERMLHV